jgi:uncharacterized protein (TIGR02271 family)
MTRTITAYFDSLQTAEKAAFDLAKKVPGVRGQVYGGQSASSLDSLSLPKADLATLHEGFRRGGGVVHLDVPDDRFEAVADALESSGAVDLDEREATWRKEGWTGGVTGTTATAATGRTGTATTGTATTGTATTGAATGGTVERLGAATDEASIPLAEERLTVGKREVTAGRVRIRSYVVETPVEEQVTLHQEHVQVERHAVDRPATAADEALFRERTIEATETSEEAVVAKDVRVREEVVLRKDAEDRTRTVSDTVRRTELEVDDDRRTAGTAATGTTTTTGKTATSGTTGTPKRNPGAV